LKVYALRHGQSVANSQGWVAGQINSPLTDKGRQQAVDAAKQIAKQDVGFGVVVSSPLERAHKTAEIIAAELGLEPPQILGELAERNVGDFAGKDGSLLNAASDEQIVANGGESEQELVDRAATIFRWVQTQSTPPLLVTHNGLMRALRFGFDQTQYNHQSLTDIERHENARLYELELEP